MTRTWPATGIGLVRRAGGPVAALMAIGLACGPKQQPSAPPLDPVAQAPFENPGGMWMPTQLAAHAEILQKLGVELPPSALTDPTAFPLGAVVSLGGCSASFVSPAGLVITNHHCAHDYLQGNSTPAANLIEQGFLAKTRADEKPGGPGARIYVTQSITEVTGKVLEGTETIADNAQRAATIAQRKLELEQVCDARDPATSCMVASYFEGAQYFEIERLEIRDVRLVYAPHPGVGVFGGDIDNWRWPRHTGDYSFIRAYVGPDGKPADPSSDNIPYKPQHHLKVATEPLSEGDFVMVAGYPGRTYRLKTAADVQDAITWRYPREIQRYDELIALLVGLGQTDPTLAIKTSSELKRLRNYRTNFQGMIDGLRDGGLAARKAKLEQDLQVWIDADPARKAKYGTVLADMAAVRAELNASRDRDAAVLNLRRAGSLLEASLAVVGLAMLRDGVGKDDPRVAGATAQVQGGLQGLNDGYDSRVEIARLAHAAARAAALPQGQRPDAVLAALLGTKAWPKLAAMTDTTQREAGIEKAVTKLVAKAKVLDPPARQQLIATLDKKMLDRSRDTLLVAARTMIPEVAALEERRASYDGAMAKLLPVYVAALREFSPTPLAPDANGTLRITYGTVRGYRPSAGAEAYAPFSTIDEMLAKNTGEEPFAAPQGVLDAAATKRWGSYADETLGTLPLDFLADLDITGGNSGSATLNAKGELVGLAFDGNYESIASDWLFAGEVARSIHVDIRYVLWMMDAVDDADHLLTEMGVTPSLPATRANP